MGGARSNSFDGAIDELAVYRSELPADELSQRYRYVPREIIRPELSSDSVTVEMFGPHAEFGKIPDETDDPRLVWQQGACGLSALPIAYDSWGVRDDWTRSGLGTMLFRQWTEIELEPGDYQLLVRSRGYSELYIDGEKLVTTPAQRNRGGAHHVVDPIAEVPVAGMRPHYMNDHERIVKFHSDGGRHEVRFDVNVGSTKYVLKVGETCAAIAREGEMFHLISPSADYELTDDGWESFVLSQRAMMDDLNIERRREAGSQAAGYWDRRHKHARESLIAQAQRPTIDSLIEDRIDQHNQAVASMPDLSEADQFYLDRVEPVLARHCARCHGEKQQGEFTILDRDRLLAGGESGEPAIVPGKPEESHLFLLVSAGADDYRMPPEATGLTQAEITDVKKWIIDGAKMPPARKQPVELAARSMSLHSCVERSWTPWVWARRPKRSKRSLRIPSRRVVSVWSIGCLTIRDGPTIGSATGKMCSLKTRIC